MSKLGVSILWPLITDLGVPFAPVRKTNRESIKPLPNLDLKLTEKVKELKTSNSDSNENYLIQERSCIFEWPLSNVEHDARYQFTAW